MQQLFTAKNVVLVVVSVVLLAIGYWLMSLKPANNSIALTIGPLIVVGVYCILLPYAILANNKEAAEPQKNKGV
ncbi:MAG: hypothetical protein GX640_01065 [Fibrobacter sp.]|nr:hypothetical protein [Fibrobacter sp.]